MYSKEYTGKLKTLPHCTAYLLPKLFLIYFFLFLSLDNAHNYVKCLRKNVSEENTGFQLNSSVTFLIFTKLLSEE